MIPITKPYFDEIEMRLLKECLDSGWVTQGPMVERFEGAFKKEHECGYAVSTTSCTAALHMAMLALGIRQGDEVIVPAFTWITSASCAEYVGAKVKFVDVKRDTMNIDPYLIEAAITENTKAIVAVHLFGCPADMDEIMDIASRHHLYVIEDCACAIGTTYKNKKVGTIGDIGCFSFHPRKTITTGEGGICSTNDEKLYYKLLQLRNHGANPIRKGNEYGAPYYMGIYDDLGYNMRLSDVQAAVGVAQFKKLKALLKDRSRCADYYDRNLNEFSELLLPVKNDVYGNTYQSYVVRLKSGDRDKRNKIMTNMMESNIQTRPGTIAITRTEYNMNKYGIKMGQYMVAEFCEDASITLPIVPFMKEEAMDRVIAKFRDLL